jgi:uncharacterized protein with ParB-like and HNH nuclease domain
MSEKSICNLITPNAKTIRKVFSEKDRYYIDIYQRDYKWQKAQIETLLRDIELRFNMNDKKVSNINDIRKDVVDNFKPYFLNTFLTYSTSGHVSIVDGQQRLTTLLIIFIAIHSILKEISENSGYEKTISLVTLENLIYESDDFGNPKYYKIYNNNRQEAFEYIIGKSETQYKPEDETQERILENHKLIVSYFEKLFKSDNLDLKYDVFKLTYYIYYILEKINMVEIHVERQEDVATIFEVVNDRGLGLKPYEILKGKFLGNLTEDKKEKANQTWVDLQNKYYKTSIKNSSENILDLDSFFKVYLRAKFADSENEYKRFEDKYHYEIYSNSKIFNFFSEFDDPEALFNWVMNDFKYFSTLYLDIRKSYDNNYLIYNKLLDQNQQYLLIISAMELNDSKEQEKITLVAKKFDQMHATMRLLDIYESNDFQEIIYKLIPKLRCKSLEDITKIFDTSLIEFLEAREVIPKGEYKTIGNLYKYELFQNISNRWVNFSKYVLMRIDSYLADVLDKPSYCKDSLLSLEDRFNKNSKKRYGIHLEHIYADNDKNKKLFTNENDIFDVAKYNSVRNKMGMVLLLKDKQNLSSGNDYYALKVNDYKTSNFIWNELLVGHIDSVDRKKLPPGSFTQIQANSDGVFPLDKVETRQKEIFEMLKHIWGF